MKQPKGSPKILITVRGVTLSAGMWMRITGINGKSIREAYVAGKDMDEFLFHGWVIGPWSPSKAVPQVAKHKHTQRRVQEVIDVKVVEDLPVPVTVYEEAPRPVTIEARAVDDKSFHVNREENKMLKRLKSNPTMGPVKPYKFKPSKTDPLPVRVVANGVEIPADVWDRGETNVRYMTMEDLRNERLALMAALKENK